MDLVATQLIVSPDQLEIAESTLPSCAVADPLQLGEILNVIDANPFYAIDTETTGLSYKSSALHGISLAVADHEWYVLGNAITPLMDGLNDIHYHQPRKGVIGHNLKFDLHFLSRFGFRPQFIADTMIAQTLVDENADLGLKTLAETRLGIADLPDFGTLLKSVATVYRCKQCDPLTYFPLPGACPHCGKALTSFKRKMADLNIMDLPLDVVAPYSAKDTRLTYDLWKVLSPDLKREGMWDIFFEKAMPFLYVLLDMEASGMYIDQQQVAALEVEFQIEADKARAEFQRLAGDVNPNSTQQLGKLLFEDLNLPIQSYTDGGKPSTDALTLQRLVSLDTTGTVAVLQELRTYEKLLSTYILPFQTLVHTDGRLYSNFNQSGAVTGRLSSSGGINLQNIPARSDLGHKVREAFCAQSEDTTLIVCDYSQLELRIVAHYSGEPVMLNAFETGLDPHQATADAMGVERFIAKNVNFGSVYGVGPDTLCDTIEKSGKPRPTRSKAKEWLQLFDATYKDLKKWKYSQIDYARGHGFVTTLLGRKRRLPDINSWDKGDRARAERQSYNAPIQGSAADIAMSAMLGVHPYLNWYGAKMLAQVHDELVFEVPKTAAEEFSYIVQENMESVGRMFDLKVKLEAKPGIGKSWSAAKESGK